MTRKRRERKREHTEAEAAGQLPVAAAAASTEGASGGPAAPASTTSQPHIPVMLAEVMENLAPRDGGRYLDATFGAGGYSRAILERADCVVVACDRDPSVEAAAADLASRFPGRFSLRGQPFGGLLDVADEEAASYAGAVFDLGVSSMQLDEAERGFSFQADGPLDMRMSQVGAHSGRTAADIVNTESEARLADILYQLGEERRSRAIAGAIVRRRLERPFERTADLAAVVERVLGRGPPGKRDRKHPATRTFQALRLHVNDEFGELERGLAAAERMLAPGGRLVVVTFHSLEDRIVKQFLATRSGRLPAGSRHAPAAVRDRAPSFQLVNAKAVASGAVEVASNNRARSAKLRAAERTTASAWPFEVAEPGVSIER